jgi:hypothetical protein
VAELRFVVAVVLAFAAEAVLVTYHLQILDAHLVAALASLHAHNFARRSYLEAERTRKKRGEEERIK